MSSCYKSQAIEENIAIMNGTVKGGLTKNEENQDVELKDSKDVSKKKKKVRLGLAFIAKSEKMEALKEFSRVTSDGRSIEIKPKDLLTVSQSLCSHIGDVVSTISGSRRYGEMTSNYLHAIIIRTAINFKIDPKND